MNDFISVLKNKAKTSLKEDSPERWELPPRMVQGHYRCCLYKDVVTTLAVLLKNIVVENKVLYLASKPDTTASSPT